VSQEVLCQCFGYLYPHVQPQQNSAVVTSNPIELAYEHQLPKVLQWLLQHNFLQPNLHYHFCMYYRQSLFGHSMNKVLLIWQMVEIILNTIGGEKEFLNYWEISALGENALAEHLMDKYSLRHYKELHHLVGDSFILSFAKCNIAPINGKRDIQDEVDDSIPGPGNKRVRIE
jgi:hypothetical protein